MLRKDKSNTKLLQGAEQIADASESEVTVSASGSYDSELTEEDEPLPAEIQEYAVTEQKNNKLLNLMKTMVEEARMEELKRTDEENDKRL